MKPTLVLDGGGLKMSYGAGVMAGFKAKGIGVDFFENIFGVSAGACVGAYFATDQIPEGERIFILIAFIKASAGFRSAAKVNTIRLG